MYILVGVENDTYYILDTKDGVVEQVSEQMYRTLRYNKVKITKDFSLDICYKLYKDLLKSRLVEESWQLKYRAISGIRKYDIYINSTPKIKCDIDKMYIELTFENGIFCSYLSTVVYEGQYLYLITKYGIFDLYEIISKYSKRYKIIPNLDDFEFSRKIHFSDGNYTLTIRDKFNVLNSYDFIFNDYFKVVDVTHSSESCIRLDNSNISYHLAII